MKTIRMIWILIKQSRLDGLAWLYGNLVGLLLDEIDRVRGYPKKRLLTKLAMENQKKAFEPISFKEGKSAIDPIKPGFGY